jgi:hypothetical protein
MRARYLNIVLAVTTSLQVHLVVVFSIPLYQTSLEANMYFGIERNLLVSSDIYDLRSI